VVLVLLAKIVSIDSPVGNALGDAIRNLVPPRALEGAVGHSELESLRRDVEGLRDSVERVIEEQSFLTRVLSQPGPLGLGTDEVEELDT
jgi:hypothetical protein